MRVCACKTPSPEPTCQGGTAWEASRPICFWNRWIKGDIYLSGNSTARNTLSVVRCLVLPISLRASKKRGAAVHRGPGGQVPPAHRRTSPGTLAELYEYQGQDRVKKSFPSSATRLSASPGLALSIHSLYTSPTQSPTRVGDATDIHEGLANVLHTVVCYAHDDQQKLGPSYYANTPSSNPTSPLDTSPG